MNRLSPIRALFVIAVLTALSALASAQTNPMFAYQGRVKVQGQPFNGSGQFKLAIVSTGGNSTLWSNNGTSSGGNEPTGSGITVPVTDGVFNLIVGDTATGQDPINPVILKQKTMLKLRTWFSDGSHGFQQLNPDTSLLNLQEYTKESNSGSELALYVSKTGSDQNNGLTTATAKLTIQGAIDTLPGRLNNNTYVFIGAGTYGEQVELYGITTAPGKTLSLIGDTTWNLASAGTPGVVISGADEPSTAPVRDYGIYSRFCDRMKFSGIETRYAKLNGIRIENGTYEFQQCLTRKNATHGMVGLNNAIVFTSQCRATTNTQVGYQFASRSTGYVTDCEATDNGSSGFLVQDGSTGSFKTKVVSDDNKGPGLQVWVYSELFFNSPMTGEIKRNTGPAVSLYYLSHAQNYNGTIGNGNIQTGSNTGGTLDNQYGGIVYW